MFARARARARSFGNNEVSFPAADLPHRLPPPTGVPIARKDGLRWASATAPPRAAARIQRTYRAEVLSGTYVRVL